MPPIEAVTFDLGDTITDLGEGRPDYAARGLVRAGKVFDVLAAAQVCPGARETFCVDLALAIEEHYAAAVARQKGLTIHQALAWFFERANLTANDGLLAACAETWCAPGPHSASLRLGARETLQALRSRGVRLGVISNTIMPGRYLDASLIRSGLIDFFPVRVYSSDVGVAKPHPAIFQAALSALHVAPARAVHVGDRLPADIAGALAVGMHAVLIEVPQRAEFAPDITADARIRELPDLLNVLENLP